MDQKEYLLKILADLQRRVLYLALVFLVASGIGFAFSQQIIRLLIQVVDLTGVNIVFTSPFQYIELAFSTAFLVGAAVVIPFFMYQLIDFVKPALKKQEYNFIISRLPLSIILFIFGFLSGLWIMKYVINLFYEKSLELQVGNLLDVSRLLSQVIMTSTLMGIAFQLPIVINLLLEFKLVSISFFERYRNIAYLLSLIFAALLPPTDLLSLVLLTIPIAFLYESSLLYYRLTKRH